MQTLKVILLLMLIGSSLQLISQVNPVSIDLRNNGVKLDAKFYPVDQTAKVPTVILLHGFPGNQSRPLGLAEELNAGNISIKGFESDHRFNNVIDDLADTITEWIKSK